MACSDLCIVLTRGVIKYLEAGVIRIYNEAKISINGSPLLLPSDEDVAKVATGGWLTNDIVGIIISALRVLSSSPGVTSSLVLLEPPSDASRLSSSQLYPLLCDKHFTMLAFDHEVVQW